MDNFHLHFLPACAKTKTPSSGLQYQEIYEQISK